MVQEIWSKEYVSQVSPSQGVPVPFFPRKIDIFPCSPKSKYFDFVSSLFPQIAFIPLFPSVLDFCSLVLPEINGLFEALPGFWGNRRIRPFISEEQKSKTEWNRGTKAILGNREHRKSRFWFWGTREMPIFFSEEQGNTAGTTWASLFPCSLKPLRGPHK